MIADLGELRDGAQRTRTEADVLRHAAGRDRQGRRARRDQALHHVFTGPYQVQAVAWDLKMHSGEVGIDPEAAGRSSIAPRDSRLARDERFPLLTTTTRWVVRRACDA